MMNVDEESTQALSSSLMMDRLILSVLAGVKERDTTHQQTLNKVCDTKSRHSHSVAATNTLAEDLRWKRHGRTCGSSQVTRGK
jgi:hypothetical protein